MDDTRSPSLVVAFASPAIVADPARHASALALLDDDQRARRARYHFARDRDLYLTMHWLERGLLSRVTGVAPERWRFGAGDHGRPHVVAPVLDVPLSVNGSHTHGLAMCGVARGAVIGVDVEQLRDDVPLEIADRFFAPAEQAVIRAAPEAERRLAFLTSWTLKESYMKARGLGMSLPLDRFSIEVGDGPPRVQVDPAWDDGIDWQLAILRPTPDHIAAVCFTASEVPLDVLPDTSWLMGLDETAR